jgi:hypothetical protein
MSRQDAPTDGPSARDGSRTAVGGTPIAVDVSGDRRVRVIWVVFLAGPMTWFAHFMLVYLVVEAGCTGDGPGLRLFDPPVPTVVTLAATAVAALACLALAGWAYRWWRASTHEPTADEAGDLSGHLEDHDRGRSLAFAGFLLSMLSFAAVLFVGLPALVLPAC